LCLFAGRNLSGGFGRTEKGSKAEASKKDRKGRQGQGEEETEDPNPLNDTHPLWLKKPSECTDEEYKEFYRKVFMDFQDPCSGFI
jgi:HSP90 family molecular chaperone